MTRDTRTQLLAAIVLLLSGIGSVTLATRLTAEAGKHKLTYTDRAEDAANTWVSAGIAMGAFRGVFVNYLWIRANAMKEAGKFYEANELASAITKLQPRFPRVWVFHAWNMAYNISVSTNTPQERWLWVNAGIRLLRDKAIPNNPNDMVVHKELAWIFLHKIGGYTDDANQSYKRWLAMEWTEVLGPPPEKTESDMDRAKAIKKYTDWLQVIADAPETLDALFEAEPTARTLVEQLTTRLPELAPTRDGLLRWYQAFAAFDRSPRASVLKQGFGERSKVFDALMRDPAHQRAWPALIAYVRKRVLVDQYHMEPDRMIRYTQTYGPIDWRHHAAHALYWSAKGVEAGLTRVTMANRKEYDFINTDRIVVQSLQDLFRSGEVYFDYTSAATGQYTVMLEVINPHFVQSYGEVIKYARDRSWADVKDRAFSPLQGGYENFLKDVISFFYRRGQMEEAEKWRLVLLTDPGQNMNDPDRVKQLSLPLNEFVENEVHDRYTSPNMAVNQVAGALQGAFVSGLLGNDDKTFLSQFEYAAKAHRYFMQEQRRITPTGQVDARMDVMDPDFRIYSGISFMDFIKVLSLDDAARVYQRAPDDLRRFAYSVLRERYGKQLEAEETKGGKSFDATFPQPSGYADWLRWFESELEKRRRKGEAIEQR